MVVLGLLAVLFPEQRNFLFAAGRVAVEQEQVNQKREYDATSEGNLRAIYNALLLYHQSEDMFPDASGWMEAAELRLNTADLKEGEAAKKLVRPDLAGQPGAFGYAFNKALSQMYKDDVKDPKTPLVFESKETSRNASGDPATMRQGLAISVDGTILKP